MQPLRQSFFAKLHKSHKSCKAHKPRVFRVFRGFAESVLRHPFCERHLRDLMKRFCLDHEGMLRQLGFGIPES